MKSLTLQPLSRIEGYGQVRLEVAEGQVRGVRVELLEDDRLFEQLVLGRPFAEVPALVCRICSICSAVHRVAAATALEMALGVEVPPLAARLRELLLIGGTIESHALHLGALVLPDLRGAESLLELLRGGDAAARQLLELKALGNRLQEVAGGRKIHPINIEVGGVLMRPVPADLTQLAAALDAALDRGTDSLELFAASGVFPPAAELQAVPLRVVAGGDAVPGAALQVAEQPSVAGEGYRELLDEVAVGWSHARQAQGADGPFLAGALARQWSRRGAWPAGIHANNAAQALEILAGLARARELVVRLLDFPAAAPLQLAVRPAAGSGTALLEAPRGVLIHSYQLDGNGRVRGADIVTPTAINQSAMEAQLLADLRLQSADADPGEVAARIVRSFDPCVSCAVHVMDGDSKDRPDV